MSNFYFFNCFSVVKKIKHTLATCLFFCCSSLSSSAQCPPNLDFEEGTFNNWQCWSQAGYTGGTPTTTLTAPVAGRHDMLSNPPGNGRDLYGNFPKNCPNGSGHSVKIGNEVTGTTADEVSYTFTIPAGVNVYNLIYHYAIVLNDAGHSTFQQPRMIISVINVTDNTPLPCPLPDIVVNGSLPGFFDSPVRAPNGSLVRCKSWAAASIKLDNLAGKTIKVSFVVTGCGLTNGSHFGYAYVDLNTECSSSFIGATYCPDDAFINVTAPYGYETYQWWNITDPTTILATTQVINFTPPPPAGTTLQVALTPYAGYGCPDTLTAQLLDTLTIFANAGPDRLSCQNAPVQLGVNPRPGFVYSWSPATGLTDPNISNPIASPSVTTQYVVTVTNAGGGCLSTDTVTVNAAVINNSIQLIGPAVFCRNDSTALLQVLAADSIQWYRNTIAIPGANQTQYNVLQSGDYYATLFSFTGCSLSTATQNITVHDSPVAGFNTNTATQCFANNQFVFTNTSTIASGTIQYNWDLGDGNTATTNNVTHSYASEGTYTVKLLATSDNGCTDTSSFTVTVNPSATAGFTVDDANQCSDNNRFVFTNTSTVSSGSLLYNWDMGDGSIINTRDVVYSYASSGTYTVQLISTAAFGCADTISFNVSTYPQPIPGFTVNAAQQCFGNNQFVFTNTSTISAGTLLYNWDLGDGSTSTLTDVTHSYAQPGDYTVKMLVTSADGCADSSSFEVKIHPFPFAGFLLHEDVKCINLPLLIINNTANNTTSTLNYLWDFGNGDISTLRNPVYSYPAPGNFNLSLRVSTAQCPLTFTTKRVPVIIDAPAPAIRYADKEAVFNFPEPLQARQIGSTAFWAPATSLDNRTSYSPVFKGLDPQLYTIKLTTSTGCITVDTQFVKTRKKIEIYVSTVFTPGSSNGSNDYLRPNLMGFVKVNYFRVYNRWGKLLYQMQSDRPGWDGRINGVVQEMQTVVWMIEAVDVDGVTHKRQGTTVLMR
jgi:gliding motility-associated-like protein